MTNKLQTFDIASMLKIDEGIHDFLSGNQDLSPTDMIHMLNIAARAKGMNEVAEKACVT